MSAYSKPQHEDIERPVHVLYLYQEPNELLSTVERLVAEAHVMREKCIFAGNNKLCTSIKKRLKKQITTVSKKLNADDILPWIKSEYEKRTKTQRGLRVFLDHSVCRICGTALDGLMAYPDMNVMVLCGYQVDDATARLLDVITMHPYVLVENTPRVNSFYAETKHRIWLDPLTGIFNRRYFEAQLGTELQRASRYEHTLSILILNINQFAAINEEFGQKTGNRILEQLAEILTKSVRSIDVVARYGGDEFVILLPETKKLDALQTAERILTYVKDYDFFKDELKVKELNISIGVAGFPEDAGGTYELIKKARNALLLAKREGGSKALACP